MIVDSVPGPGPVVGLTFDDGPNPLDTPRLLDVLDTHDVAAVFCLWGEHVDRHPVLARTIAEAGHVLGNHSMRHEDMTGWPAARVMADLLEADATIRRAVPDVRIPFFRAPYGGWGCSPDVAVAMGMRPLGWRLAVDDWEPPGTDELVRRLRAGITPGAVVLLHDGGGDRHQTVDAVHRVIPMLKAEGWRFAVPEADLGKLSRPGSLLLFDRDRWLMLVWCGSSVCGVSGGGQVVGGGAQVV